MDAATTNLIGGLVIGCIMGALLALRLVKERVQAESDSATLLIKAANRGRDTANQLREATVLACDKTFAEMRSKQVELENELTNVYSELVRVETRLVRAQARLHEVRHCKGCNEGLQHDPYCFTCGLHETVSETVRAVA